MFSVKGFLEAPSLEGLELCRKDDLLQLAEHFGVSVSRSDRKQIIKEAVLAKLIQEGVLQLAEVPDPRACLDEGPDVVVEKKLNVEIETGVVDGTEVPPATVGLSPFRSFSPPTGSSAVLSSAKLKLRLAKIENEAKVRENEFRLEVRRLEIEADQEVHLRKLELEATKSVTRPVQ